MNKLLFNLFVITILFVSPAVADQLDGYFSCNGSKLVGAEAEKELLRVQDSYQNASSFSSNFVQDAYLAALDVSEKSTGKVWYQKIGKMRWSYQEPEKQELVIKDNTFWYYQPELEQVRISDLRKIFLTDMPVSFLLGIGNLSKDFQVEYSCKTQNGGLLSLVPRSKGEKEVRSFILSINEGRYPLAAKIDHPGGNKTTIVLDGVEYGTAVPAKIFDLEIPKNVDIIDDRK